MKFDVIIGNPPYNKGIDIDFACLLSSMYNKYCSLIVPAKWQTADLNQLTYGEANYKIFREKVLCQISTVIFYPCCRDIFDILQVDGITIVLMDRNKHSKVTIENRSKHLKELNSISERTILNRESLFNIGNEIVEYLGDYPKFNFDMCGKTGRFQVWTNNKIPGGGLSTLESPRKTLFIGESHLEDTASDKKEYTNAFTMTFASDNIDECKSFISWLNCKFTRFFVAINISRLTGIMTDDYFRFVPAPINLRFDHIYTDEELYKYFKLTDRYIEVIESLVKER